MKNFNYDLALLAIFMICWTYRVQKNINFLSRLRIINELNNTKKKTAPEIMQRNSKQTFVVLWFDVEGYVSNKLFIKLSFSKPWQGNVQPIWIHQG